MKVYRVYLVYDIMFDDSDHGNSYAGEGTHTLKVFDNEIKAQNFIETYREVIQLAEKEIRKQIFPRLPNHDKINTELWFDIADLNGENFKLNYKVMKVE